MFWYEKINTEGMTNNYDIFISYSRHDLEQVRHIKEELERITGASCWMDLDGIESGEQFKKVIISAINRCDTLLFMLSNRSMRSEWALDELNFAKNKKKRLVIVHLEYVEQTEEFNFTYHKYDQIDWSNSSQKEKLLSNINKWIEKAEKIEKHTNEIEANIEHHLPASNYLQKKSIIDVSDGTKSATVVFDVGGKRTEKVFSYEDEESKILYEKMTGSEHLSDYDSSKADKLGELDKSESRLEADERKNGDVLWNSGAQEMINTKEIVPEIGVEPEKHILTSENEYMKNKSEVNSPLGCIFQTNEFVADLKKNIATLNARIGEEDEILCDSQRNSIMIIFDKLSIPLKRITENVNIGIIVGVIGFLFTTGYFFFSTPEIFVILKSGDIAEIMFHFFSCSFVGICIGFTFYSLIKYFTIVFNEAGTRTGFITIVVFVIIIVLLLFVLL